MREQADAHHHMDLHPIQVLESPVVSTTVDESSNRDTKTSRRRYFAVVSLLVAFLLFTLLLLLTIVPAMYRRLAPQHVEIYRKNLYAIDENYFQREIISTLKENNLLRNPSRAEALLASLDSFQLPTLVSSDLIEEEATNPSGDVREVAEVANVLSDSNFDFKILSYVNKTHFAVSLTSYLGDYQQSSFNFVLYRDGKALSDSASPRISLESFEREHFVCEKTSGDGYGVFIYQMLFKMNGMSLDLEKQLSLRGVYDLEIKVENRQSSTMFRIPTSFVESPNQQFVVLSFGDMDTNYNSLSTVLNLATELKPETKMIFHQGDIPYAWDGSQRKWEIWGRQVQSLTENLFYNVGPGNHEKSAHCDFDSYIRRFSKWGGVNSRSNTNLFYSFNYLGVHWVSLSSEHDYTPQSEQYKWLIQDLKNVDREKTPFVIAFAHRPMYSSNQNHGSDEKLREHIGPVLEANRVDLALFGHVHAYERAQLNANGTVYVEVGTAGYEANPKWEQNVPAWSQYRETAHGYLKLFITPGKLLKGQFMTNYFDIGGRASPVATDKFEIPVKHFENVKAQKPVFTIFVSFSSALVLFLFICSILGLVLCFYPLLNSMRRHDSLEYMLAKEFANEEMDLFDENPKELHDEKEEEEEDAPPVRNITILT